MLSRRPDLTSIPTITRETAVRILFSYASTPEEHWEPIVRVLHEWSYEGAHIAFSYIFQQYLGSARYGLFVVSNSLANTKSPQGPAFTFLWCCRLLSQAVTECAASKVDHREPHRQIHHTAFKGGGGQSTVCSRTARCGHTFTTPIHPFGEIRCL